MNFDKIIEKISQKIKFKNLNSIKKLWSKFLLLNKDSIDDLVAVFKISNPKLSKLTFNKKLLAYLNQFKSLKRNSKIYLSSILGILVFSFFQIIISDSESVKEYKTYKTSKNESSNKTSTKLTQVKGYKILGVALNGKKPGKCLPSKRSYSNMLFEKWEMWSCKYKDEEDHIEIWFDGSKKPTKMIKIIRKQFFTLYSNPSSAEVLKDALIFYGNGYKKSKKFWSTDHTYTDNELNQILSIDHHQCNRKNDFIRCTSGKLYAIKYEIKRGDLGQLLIVMNGLEN